VCWLAGVSQPPILWDAVVRGQSASLRALLAASGIVEGKPLYAVLTTIHEASETALATVTDKARGLTSEGERELIQRVVTAAGDATEREAARIVRRLSLIHMAMLVTVGLALGGGGFYAGSRFAVGAANGASFMANVAALNADSSLEVACRKSAYKQGDGVACVLPPVSGSRAMAWAVRACATWHLRSVRASAHLAAVQSTGVVTSSASCSSSSAQKSARRAASSRMAWRSVIIKGWRSG
jgi:hypothetical protein